MGDIADQLIEEGMDELARHDSEQCGEGGPCPYCPDDYDDEDPGEGTT